MAKEKEPKAHQLYKQIPQTNVVYHSAGSIVTNGWEIVTDTASHIDIAFRSYIDLSGWSKQDLTTFVQGIDIQKQMIPLKTAGAAGMLKIYEFDFITTRRLTNAELSPTNLFDLPGFLKNTVDLMEVIYGERMEYGSNLQIPGSYVQISAETFGSGNPTAMDKLHWTRLLVFDTPQEGETGGIFATNLIVSALTVEEKDLVWMERLRRSYVLQDQADV